MAATESEAIAPERDMSSDLSSSGGSEDEGVQVEWLATAREKRSTAGNRMKTMLANEEPDSDLELLFAEDEDDAGFTDVDAASDVHMDSSSDSEDDQNNADDLQGEKELEKQAKERRNAARKRKAQDAIPVKFRKKARIDQPAPAPRPKKKSERTSWLPSPLDAPTRASARQTTMLSKEQLHQQMVEREERRLKQAAAMEKKAKRLAALKKPPMTQAERLAEAAVIEKRNAKSLNRWEVAERAREEERLAKLAALNNRTLKGPVVTFWSGMGQWEEGASKHVGMHVVIEEKPKKAKEKKEKEPKKGKEKGKDKDKDKDKDKETNIAGSDPSTPTANSTTAEPAAAGQQDLKSEVSTPAASASNTPGPEPIPESSSLSKPAAPSDPPPLGNVPPSAKIEEAPRTMAPPPIPRPPITQPPAPKSEESPRLMAPPLMPPPPTTSPSPMAPPSIPPPPGLKAPVLALPVLAPPLGGIHLGSSSMSPKSNVLAPPNTTQRPSPLSLPPTTPGQAQPAAPAPRPPPPPPLTHLQPTQPQAAPKAEAPAAPTPPAPEQPPSPTSATRSAIILQNFDENSIKDKVVQTQVLFGRKMSKLGKHAPQPLCAITNHPARYRDPKTGLPYFNAYAYREIQRLRRGDYKWSRLVGAWVGSGTYAARGVPARFLSGKKEDEKAVVKPEAEATEDAQPAAAAPAAVAEAAPVEKVK